VNGGISLADVSGTVDLKTVNGGVDIDRAAGHITGRIQKRIEVTLGRGGAPIRAVTTNGGISLRRRSPLRPSTKHHPGVNVGKRHTRRGHGPGNTPPSRE
jgi:hypothetical protein